MSETAVMGLDVGGTSTRVAIALLDGTVLAATRGDGANPTTHGATLGAARLGAAVSAALSAAAGAGLAPGDVRAATIGLAGVARFRDDPGGRAALAAAWREAGLTCDYTLVADALLGYCAGSERPAGTVVIAGTGAIAAAVRDFALDHLAGGHGWLLGDEGSGYWLGREAVRAALSDLDRCRTPGPLSRRVLAAALGSTDGTGRATAQALVQWATTRPPVALAELAPTVLAGYDTDPVAWALVERAAAHLADTAAVVHRPGRPIVLGGGLLTGGTPLAAAVTAALAAAWPDATITPAGDTAAAAAWLAARELPGVADPSALHRRLLGR